MSENNRKTYSTSSLFTCLHYVKNCSKSDPTDRLEPAGNGCKMSELNLEPARLIYWRVTTGTTGYSY